MDLIKAVEQEQIRKDLQPVDIGDYVRVFLKVKEGNRERLQAFDGTVIAKKGHGLNETFTVRRISYGVGVERVLPLNSPKIDHIDIVRKGKIRRAKLYYLRDRIGKAARVREKLGAKASKTKKADIEETEQVLKEETLVNEEVTQEVTQETTGTTEAAEEAVESEEVNETVEATETAPQETTEEVIEEASEESTEEKE